MKTLLVLTDFSINANYVAHYALEMAQKIEANLLLYNIYKVPEIEENKNGKAWPMQECEENSINNLGELTAQLKDQMDKNTDPSVFRPDIEQCSEPGIITDKLNELAATREVLLAVISVHNPNNLANSWAVNHAWNIIDNANFPVLLIPYQAKFKDYKLIAFATSMNYTDVNVLEYITGLAKYSEAEILLTHVANEESDDKMEELTIKDFFNQMPLKTHYPKISYKNIKSSNIINSLKLLTAQADVDVLVLVHHRRNYFNRLFGNSITQHLTHHTKKPLLIFPGSTIKKTLTVF